MPDPSRPTAAQIRRALAECMTVGDVDDAMGWEPGTARGRRWRDAARGGLPPADAELGGVALWFRSTIEGWRERAEDPDDEAEPAEPVEPDEDEPDEEGPDGEPDEEPEPDPEPEPAALASGYELEPGQPVLVQVRGRWREAHVRHRDRTTVAVDYTLDGTPSGLRRQRVGLDRIRLPES